GIGQADAEEIEVHRVSQVPLGKEFRGAQIEERRAPALILELAGEFARTDQELRVRVALEILHHRLTITWPSCSVTRPSSRSLARWARTVSSATGRSTGITSAYPLSAIAVTVSAPFWSASRICASRSARCTR